jgi:phosphoglycolate phosphatase
MRLVIFDMDGTLIDSVGLIVETMRNAFEAVGEPTPEPKAIRAISGITAREAIGILAPQADQPRVDALLESYRTHYRRGAGLSREPMFEGALEALKRLHARPDTILAVATGKGFRGAMTLLDAHGVTGHFNSVQTPDHNRGKPDPQMIETAMARAGVSAAETVMIGDTVHDMRMAKSAGVGAIGVAWGYHLPDELLGAGADIVIERFDALDAAIDGLVA